MDQLFIFRVCKLHSHGGMSTIEFCGEVELDETLAELYGKHGQLVIIRNDGKAIQFDDNGSEWEVARKFFV